MNPHSASTFSASIGTKGESTLKTKRDWFATSLLAVLLVSLATPLVAPQTYASEEDDNDDLRIVPGTWYKLESEIVTVLFPSGGRKPMFIWWYNNAPDQIYVVKYQGLIEYLAFEHILLPSKAEYYHRIREAWQEIWRERFSNWYFEPEESRWMDMSDVYKLMLLHQIMSQMWLEMETKWHKPFLPFDAGRWSLSNIGNITTPDGKIIGLSFTFKLVELPDWMQNLQFAENNIMIRVRIYNETVEETLSGTDFTYKVNAGEMKMDFVVNKWVWNIDTIKQLVAQLREEGFNINIPEGRSRLALWVNLASFNISNLSIAQEKPEEIEEHSMTTHMEIEDHTEDITANKTATEGETPIELSRPKYISLRFANQTKTLGGFFRFVSSAKTTGYPNEGDVNMVPVKAAYIAAGAHMRLFIGYPYFGNGTLEHDPSIGVDVPNVDNTPKYTVQAPSGANETPVVIGKYMLPPFTPELMAALIVVVSATAIMLYAARWKRKTPVNMVGVGTTG